MAALSNPVAVLPANMAAEERSQIGDRQKEKNKGKNKKIKQNTLRLRWFEANTFAQKGSRSSCSGCVFVFVSFSGSTAAETN